MAAGAAELAVGAMAGAAATNVAAANAYAASAAAAYYPIGAVYSALPANCPYQSFGGSAYYSCYGAWFSPAYGANGMYYRVVAAP
jgi:hypothetical protein